MEKSLVEVALSPLWNWIKCSKFGIIIKRSVISPTSLEGLKDKGLEEIPSPLNFEIMKDSLYFSDDLLHMLLRLS